MTSPNVPELNGVRGLACLGVLLAHCIAGLLVIPADSAFYNAKSAILAFGLGGVDLFFVLSGFLIGGILLDARNATHFFRTFWIRRVTRIFPVAYLLLVSYGAALLVRAKFDLPQLDLFLLSEPRPPIWTFATFMQSLPFAANGPHGPGWMGITWSLAIEEQFYVFFPFAVYFLSRRSLAAAVLAGIMLAPVMRHLVEAFFGNWFAAYVLLPSRMDALFFGVAAALIVRNERALALCKRLRWVLDAVALWLAYQIATYSPFLSVWPSPTDGPFPPLKHSALAFVCAVLILRVFLYHRSAVNALLRSSVLANIGLISYGLYMYHQAVNGLLHGFIFNQAPKIASPAHFTVALLVVAASVVLATLSYVCFERPIRRLGRIRAEKYKSEPVCISTRVASATP